MRFGSREWRYGRSGELRIAHHPDLEVESIAQAIARHRENAAKGSEAFEHWGRISPVSRVVFEATDRTKKRVERGPITPEVTSSPWGYRLL